MSLRAGLIGAGRMGWAYDGGGWNGHSPSLSIASCLNRHPQTRLVAVYDPAESARQAFDDGYQGALPVALYDDLEAFLGAGLDLVAIASPTACHAAHIEACLDAGIARLWVEKPVTLDLADFIRLRACCAEMDSRPRICVNYMRRSLPQLAFMRRHLAESPDPPGMRSLEVRYSRGLAVNGVHMLDLIGAVTGAESVPELDFIRPVPSANPQFGLTLNGVPVTINGHDLPYHLIEMAVTDSRGRLSLVRGGENLLWQASEPNPDYPGFYRLGDPAPVEGLPEGAAAMQEASYQMLCSLLDESAAPLSTLETAWFAQALLDRVPAASGASA